MKNLVQNFPRLGCSLALVALLAACGGGSDTAPTLPASAQPVAATTAPAPAMASTALRSDAGNAVAGSLVIQQWQFYGRSPAFTPFASTEQQALNASLAAIAKDNGNCPVTLMGRSVENTAQKSNETGQLIAFERAFTYQAQTRSASGECQASQQPQQGVIGAVFPIFDAKEEAKAAAQAQSPVVTVGQTDALKVLAVSSNSVTLAKTTASSAIVVGSVLVSDVLAGAPDGLLRKVTQVSIRGNQIVFATTQADFSEISHAIQPGNTRIAVPARNLSAGATVSSGTAAAPGGFLLADPQGYFSIVTTAKLSSGAFVRVIARVKPAFEWIWDKEPDANRPKFMRLKMTLDVQNMKLIGQLGITQSVTLMSIELPPVTVWAGVPIVFRNSIKLGLGGTASANSSLVGGLVIPSGSVAVGLDYVRDVGWTNLSASNASIELLRPAQITPNYSAMVEFPQVAFESAPYGFGLLKFTASAALWNQISYTPSDVDKPIKVKTTPLTNVGLAANFFGLVQQSYAYTTLFADIPVYEGTLAGLTASTDPVVTEPTPVPRISDALTDIQGTWAYNEIAFMVDQGLMSGYADKTFRPAANVTRGEFAAMLVSSFDPAPNPACANRTFNDISGHWAEGRILRAARACFLSGFADGSFKPGDPLTKVQVLSALTGGIVLEGNRFMTLAKLFDNLLIPSWARTGVANAAENLLMVNYPNMLVFDANKNSTRAETVAVLYRALVRRGNLTNAHESAYLYTP